MSKTVEQARPEASRLAIHHSAAFDRWASVMLMSTSSAPVPARILLIDDQAEVVGGLTTMLAAAGYACHMPPTISRPPTWPRGFTPI